MAYWVLKIVLTPVIRLLFHVRSEGTQNVPRKGPVILASNHQSFIDSVFLPLGPKALFVIVMRVPEETSGSAHSTVAVDQYSGNVLQVHDFLTDSLGYRWIRFNRSIHTGDIWGLPGHIIASVSSLLLVAMVITGLVIWWKKLAV